MASLNFRTGAARTMRAALAVFFASGAALGAQDRLSALPLTVDEAVGRALSSDARIAGALLDLEASRKKEEEARLRRLPALSLSAGYTRLSEVNSTISFGGNSISLDSPVNAFALAANLQYPVFAGFRLREAEKLAGLQSRGKEIAAEATRNAIAFETRRAYWEAARAAANADMLKENLSLMDRERDVVKQKLAQGTALNADLLAAQMRRDQAEMDFGDAADRKERAFLLLASLVLGDGENAADAPAADRLALRSRPDGPAATDGTAEIAQGGSDARSLIAAALAMRPETRSAALAAEMAEAGVKLAEAPLYPTLSLSGNYTYADPNSRVYFQSSAEFIGTWNLGVALSYDLGGTPANLAARDAARDAVKKSAEDLRRQQELVSLDVRNCLAAYGRARKDVALVTKMLSQAQEAERVTASRVKNGTAEDLDLLSASLARLRGEFAISNKEIDLQIASADLKRALGRGGND